MRLIDRLAGEESKPPSLAAGVTQDFDLIETPGDSQIMMSSWITRLHKFKGYSKTYQIEVRQILPIAVLVTTLMLVSLRKI